MSREDAVKTVSGMVESAKTLLQRAEAISREHGLAFEYSLHENTYARQANGWDDSGCTIDYDYGWQSSEVCW